MSMDDSSSEEIAKKVDNLVSLFVWFCRTNDEVISPQLSLIVINVLLRKPKWRTILGEDASLSDKSAFFTECYNLLFSENSIASSTLKMQCLFYERYLKRDQLKLLQKRVRAKKCSFLMQKLKRRWHNPTEDFREMHDDLVRLVLIKEGMDDPMDSAAFDEVKAAMSSVLPVSSLSSFVQSNDKTKTDTISGASAVAVGIRLHAWYGQRAGAFMVDVGKIMKETLPAVVEDFHEELSSINDSIASLSEDLKSSINSSEDSGSFQKKALLIKLTNYQNFVKVLKESVDDVAAETYKLDYTSALQTQQLDNVLKIRCYDSKAKTLYPLYKDLAKTWKQIQVEGRLLSLYTNIYHDLKKLMAQNNEHQEVPDFEDFESPKQGSKRDETSVVRIEPKDVKNFSEITLENNEFCTYLGGLGVLVPCDRQVGIAQHMDRCYGFSSGEALQEFCQDPEGTLQNLFKWLLMMPELIMTLRMEDVFSAESTSEKTRVQPIFINSSGDQTVVHPIEENLDYTYNWNQWDLRRQALKYVDLLTRQTHSTQTNVSNFRRENYCQIYFPKDDSTQMDRDASTLFPKRKHIGLSTKY